jgi:predicted permease
VADLKYAVKLLWKDKGFSLTATLTLAICIGAQAAIFSIVHSVLLQPLPFSEPERILLLYNSYPHAGVARAATGVPDYYDRLREVDAFEEQALYDFVGRTIGEAGSPQRVRVLAVTPSFFRLLRAEPLQGRTFTEEEGEIGNEKKIVLSHRLWQQLFAGDPGALGKDLRVNGVPFTLVGVMPENFLFLSPEVALFTPLAFSAEQKSDDARHSNNWEMLGRLKPGASLAQAQMQIDALNARNDERFPQFKQILSNAGFRTVVVPFQEELVKDIRATLYLLWGGVAFVLLIGCVNAANLVLVRSHVRLRELATRHALGAGRFRLARQLVSETLLLTGVGGGLGLIAGYAALRLTARLGIEEIPRGSEIGMGPVTLGYTLGLTLLIGVLLGLAAVVHVLRSDLSSVLHEEGRSATVSRGLRLVRRGLVVLQVAFALILLVGAGLLLASFRRVLEVDPGFRPEQVATAAVSLPASRYPEPRERQAFVSRALEKIRALPGVLAAGVTDTIPLGGSYSDSVILAEGYQMAPGESLISPSRSVASPGYFEAMGIPLLQGRFFTEADREESPRVIIVDRELAQRFWPQGDPLGKRMFLPDNPEDLLNPSKNVRWLTVVGVVGKIRQRGLVEAPDRVGAYYFPYRQSGISNMTFALRTGTEPESLIGPLRREITELDPELPVFDARTMSERLEDSLLTRKVPIWISLAFAGVALFLAAVGLYGVLAYLVTQRSREFGIRLALGSTARGIFDLVVREGAQILALGFVFGLVGVYALRRVLEAELYGVRPLEPAVLLGVAGLLALVALVACLLPARRATRIDPVVALRQE